MRQHNSSSLDRGIDTSVIDEFQVRTNATFGPEFDAELDRLVAAAHEYIIHEEYPDEQWGPRMEHELRAALRRMLVMETPAEEIIQTVRIAEFSELSRQSQRDTDRAQTAGHETSDTSRDRPGSGRAQ